MSSREAHQKQKQLAQERKAAKPLADEVHRTKKLWERLRRKSHVPKEERQQLVDELYSIITGRIKDFVLKHDAVRAVQTAIKYSTPSQRKQIAKELQGTYAQLAESRYAKFLVAKLLVTGDEEIRDLIIPEFYGKVRKLINHPEASWILDDIYRQAATKEQKAHLLREWYGPEFSLFKSDSGKEVTAELSKILEEEPSKRVPVMKYLFDMTNTLIQKKMTGFTMLHDAMLQYFLNLKPESEELKEFFETIKGDETGDLLKNMAFTKSGARLVCLLLAHGNAKDRKQIIKTYKDTIQLMCADPHAHMVLLAAYDVIDDTVLTSKTIFPELLGRNEEKNLENIIPLANDLNARITVCYLFEGPSRALFPASHSYDLELLAEIHEIRKKTSKKDPEVRRKELVAAISPPLLAAVAASPADLVATSFGCQFVADVLLAAIGDKKAALEAVASTAAGDPNKQPEDADPLYPPPPHISLTTHGGKMFKTLIAGGRFDKAAGCVKRVDPPLNFADILYPVIKDYIVQWATGPSSFTVLGLLEAPDFSSKKELIKILKANKKVLEEAAKGDASNAEETKKEGKESKKKRKEPAPEKEKAKSGGNMGAKLILEKLAA
jgi:pumilio family protein 6